MAVSNPALLNKGKRRLGRFPIPSASTTAKKPDYVINNSKSLQKHESGGGTEASFLASFSSSTDNTLLMEVEEMEATMGAQIKDLDKVSPKDKNKASHSLIKPNIKTVIEEAEQNMPYHPDGSALEKLSHHEYRTRGGAKRSHMQACVSSHPDRKSSAQGLDLRDKNASKALVSSKKLSTPTASPLDKRQRRISKILPVIKKSTILNKQKTHDIDKNVLKNNTYQKASTHIQTPSKQRGHKDVLTDSNDLEISYSPLLSTPFDDSNICDITSEESPPAAPTSLMVDSVNRGKLSSKKAIASDTLQKIKSKQKTPSRMKNSLDIIVSPQNSKEGANKISVTPRRPVKASSVIKKRPSPVSINSPESIAKKVERKGEGKSRVGSLSKGKGSIHGTGITPDSSNRSASYCQSKSPCSSRSTKARPNASDSGNSTSYRDLADKVTNETFAAECLKKTQNISTITSISDVSVSEDKRQLSQWGLPQPVLEAYRNQGVTTMFEWQAECLLTDNVLDGRNLVFSAPTSAGKTLVAELLVLKRVVETKKKALFVLPFVSVAREKMYALQRLYQDAGIRVGGYMGSYSPPGGLAHLDVAVCTIEKGNGIINRLMEEDKLSDLGVMVVDELHMVGDSHRGYLLELMLTKLAYITHKAKTHDGDSQQHIQLIGMSATLPNLDLLSRWLDAALFCTDFRPVPLTEHIKVNTRILDKDLQVEREISASLLAVAPDDADHVIALCLETVTNGNAVLIFCPAKNWCEKLCETIAKKFYSLKHQQRSDKSCNVTQPKEGTSEESPGSEPWNLYLDRFKLAETVEQLRRCPVGVDPMLGRCLLNGVAYHHAGLTFDERDIIEGAFRQGQIKVLVATSTLSSGVNLPARRVIVRTPMFHGNVIDTLTYKQMAGRAGRKGVDTQGESILICKPQEKLKGKNLLQADLPPVESCLHFDPDEGLSRSLKRAVLEVVVSGVAPGPEDVMTYVNCTLLSASMHSAHENNNSVLIESCIEFLQDNEFVTVQKSTNEDGTEVSHFHPTLLGSAILASSLSPDEGLAVFSELQKARRAFALDTDLHIIYLVTPMYASDMGASPDWCHYYALWESLTPPDRRVAEMVGVSEAFIARAINGRRINGKSEAQKKQLSVHIRFYTALILYNLVREVPLVEVANKFNYNKGQLQSLQQSAATYAGMITVLCGRLGWHSLETLLSGFQHRLSSGVQPELVDLVRVTALSATSARMLYNAGYTTVAQLARAKPVDCENLFRTSVPFQSDKQQEGETAWEAKERQRARCIWLTGRKGVTELEAAQAIIDEAKDIVQGDLGAAAISWESEEEEEEEEEEEGESVSKCGEDHDLPPQKNRGNNDVYQNSDHALSRQGDIEKETTHSGWQKRNELYSITSKKSTKKASSPKEENEKNLCGDLPAPENSGAVKCAATSTIISENSNLNLAHTDPEIVKSQKVQACATSNRGRLKNPQKNHGGSARQRRSSSSLDGSNNSSLNHSHSFSSGKRSNRNSFFGQTVLSPPAGIVRSASKFIRDEAPSSSSLTTEGKLSMRESDITPVEPKIRLSFGLNSEKEPIQLSPVLKTIPTDNHACEVSTPGTGGSKQISLKDGKSVEKVQKREKSDRICEDFGFAAGSLTNENPPKQVNSLPLMKDDQHCISAEARDLFEATMVSKVSSTSQSANLNDYSFSASIDLDSQTAKLVNDYDECQSYSSEARTSKVSVPEYDIRVRQSMTKAKEMENCNLSPINTLNDAKSNSFNDSFSEALFDECDEGASAGAVLEKKDGDLKGKTSQSLQNLSGPTQGADKSELCVDRTEKQGKNVNSSLEVDMMSEEEQGKEEDEVSLIAASNRFEHFDEGMIEDELSESLDVSFTQLKTRPGNEKTASKSADFGRALNTVREDNQGLLLADNAEEDENLLLAVLDQSSPFETSPFPALRANHNEDVPQNSTPVGSFTNVSSVPSLAPQCTTETPTSHTSLSMRNLRHREIAANSMQIHSKKDFSTPMNTLSKQADEQAAAEDFFTDSFSLTLMDRIMTECDNLQIERKTALNETCPAQTQNGNLGKENKERKIDIDSKVGMSIEENPESANSSRHDGSDCVPPTPPEETSHASPLKMSFYSPLKPKRLRHDSKSQASNVVSSASANLDKPSAPQKSQKSKTKRVPKRGCQLVDSAVGELNGPISAPAPARLLGGNQSKHDLHPEQPSQVSKAPRQPHPQPSPADATPEPCLIPSSQGTSQLTQQSFTIIDVCADRRLFDSFLAEWKMQTSFSLSVACEKLPQNDKPVAPCGAIGQRFTKKKPVINAVCDVEHISGIPVPDSKHMVVGLAISWEKRDVYFVTLMPVGYVAECDPNDSLSEPVLDNSLTQEERILAITEFFGSRQRAKPKVIVYDTKDVYITLAKSLGITLTNCEDPRVADWMEGPTSRLKNLHHMVAAFSPEELSLLDAVGGASSYGSIGLELAHSPVAQTSGRVRACTESVLARILMERHYLPRLAEEHLLEAFTEVEMPALLTLARMELNGFGVCEAELESQKTLMTTKLTALEEQAYEMAGHPFSLTSTDDISKILYSELKLPINGDPSVAPRLLSGRGQGRGRTGSGAGLMGSTSKEVLEKLTKFHPLPAVVLEWRRISSALTKSLFALQRTARLSLRLDMPRVFGECQIFTATGRVSMAEPNVQNIPKDFAIELPDYIGESPTASQPISKVTRQGSKLAAMRGNKQQTARILDPHNVITAPVSLRKMFVPFKGGVLLAADYSQLELRVIAHLSRDSKLAAVLNTQGGDVFKMIAAQMHNVEVEGVTSAQRQQAKQVCYGMLYGIGPKALGEQLGVDENDAGAFMEMFKSRYPGVRKYLRDTVEFCQKNGYVKTMFNRRRYLPSIKHSNPHARAHAERQAVNTTVQGSAADLVKQAMVDIDRKLMHLFPDSRSSHSHKQAGGGKSDAARIRDIAAPYGAFLVLQLHDELLYETSEDALPVVAPLVKAAMEGAVKMAVTMPVKLKVGPSWGELQDWSVT